MRSCTLALFAGQSAPSGPGARSDSDAPPVRSSRRTRGCCMGCAILGPALLATRAARVFEDMFGCTRASAPAPLSRTARPHVVEAVREHELQLRRYSSCGFTLGQAWTVTVYPDGASGHPLRVVALPVLLDAWRTVDEPTYHMVADPSAPRQS